MKILVTCPPMLGMIESFRHIFEEKGVELSTPDVVQTMSVEELKKIVPQHDGWIIGDDPATREVFEAGKSGNLKAAVKWGIGVDNVDFEASKSTLSTPIPHLTAAFRLPDFPASNTSRVAGSSPIIQPSCCGTIFFNSSTDMV